MKKRLLLIVAGVAGLHAQTPAGTSNFQHHGWIAAPGSTTVTVRSTRPDGQTGPVLGRPFSATEVRLTTQTLADGTHVNQAENSAFHRDGQGRMRTESRSRILIYDPVAGFIYNLNPADKTYQKTPIHGTASIAVVGNSTWIRQTSERPVGPVASVTAHGVPFHSEPVTQSSTEDLSPQVINGIGVKGSRVTMTIPKGTFGNDREVQVINERWFSDSLQVLVKSTNTDPRFGVSSYELTNILQAPPDPTMFQVPADYTLSR